MSMKRFLVVVVLGLGAAFWSISCQGPDELFRNAPGGLTGTAGTISPTGGQGGTAVSGTAGRGAAGTGAGGSGRAGTNGMAGTMGNAGTNGMAGTMGNAGTNGMAGTMGNAGTNGMAGTMGNAGTNGMAGTMGNAGTNGMAGTMGKAGTNGMAGTMGKAGTNGMAGTMGMGGGGAAKNCIDAIKLNGYSATGAPPCSMCKNNQTDESSKCEKTIDCEDAAYPCDGSCKLNCQNSQGDDSVVSGCVNSLLTAASCS